VNKLHSNDVKLKRLGKDITMLRTVCATGSTLMRQERLLSATRGYLSKVTTVNAILKHRDAINALKVAIQDYNNKVLRLDRIKSMFITRQDSLEELIVVRKIIKDTRKELEKYKVCPTCKTVLVKG